MSDEYQMRKDIDELYFLVWDNTTDAYKLLTIEEFDEYKSETNEQITDIYNTLYLTTYTVSASDYDSDNLTTCAMTFNKQGSIVTCIYHLVTVSFNDTSDYTVLASGKIPSEYRPSNTFYQNVCTYDGDKLDGLLTINPDGSMYIRMGTANTSMDIYGSLTYIV